MCDNVYISDKVKLKRKELHNFDMQVRKAFDMLGEVETSGKPEICIVTPEEMRVNAIASYMPMQNVLNVNSAYFSTSDLSDLQENLACPQDGLSTILHELIHWQDAKITEQNSEVLTIILNIAITLIKFMLQRLKN